MNIQEFAKDLDMHIRPASFPLAIRMLKSDESLPDKVKRPKRDLGVQIATCQGITMARRYGWTVGIGREDLNCVLTKAVYGFEKRVPYYTEGNCACGMYTETQEAGALTEEETDKFEYGEYEHILIAPAAKADFEPMMVLAYGNSAQVMRMLTGALYKRGGAITSSFTGRIDCSDSIIRTIKRNDYQVILPCYGDRVFGQTYDDEMAFTIPASKIDEMSAGLAGTHRGGIRYPIPSFLRYSGEFPKTYNKLEQIWREEKKD